MKILISNLSYNIINTPEPAEDGTVGEPIVTPVTETEQREFDIPDSVVEELKLTDTSYQEIGQYLVENLPKEIGGHPISGIAWEVVKNIVPFVEAGGEPIMTMLSGTKEDAPPEAPSET